MKRRGLIMKIFSIQTENMKSLFGIKRGLIDIPKWSEFKLGNGTN